jgi:metallo-beta-lactamase family protein
MPVYAIGRSQDVLYVLNQLTLDGVLDRPRVFLDSPMAIRAAEVYARHVEAFDEEAVRLIRHPPSNPRAPHVQFTESAAASRAIARMSGVIILAGSGMCEGGRIHDHLARHLGDPRSSVIVTGFQAAGTLGRRLVDGAAQVSIHGHAVPVKAAIHTINGLSAHADQRGLLEWVGGFRDPKPRTFLVHGELEKMRVLASMLKARHGIDAHLPAWRETVNLDG